MIKLIQPKKFRMTKVGQQFSKKIAEKSASFYSYDEAAELTFLNFSAQNESNSLEEILDLLMMALGLLKNGLGLSVVKSEAYLLSQVRVLLEHQESYTGGNHEVYVSLYEAYNALAEGVNQRSVDESMVSRVQQKLESCMVQLGQEKSQREQFVKTLQKGRSYRELGHKQTMVAQNSLNGHIYQLMRRNRQLASLIGNSPEYLQLISKQIENSRKKQAFQFSIQNFYYSLSKRQREELYEWIVENGLFSKERTQETEEAENLKTLLDHASIESVREFFQTLRAEMERRRTDAQVTQRQSMQEMEEDEAYQYYELKKARFEEYRKVAEEIQKEFKQALFSLIKSRAMTQAGQMLEEIVKMEQTFSSKTEEDTQVLTKIKSELQQLEREENKRQDMETNILQMNRDTLTAYSDYIISYANETIDTGKTEQSVLRLAEQLEQTFYDEAFASQGFEILRSIWEGYLKEYGTKELWSISKSFFQTDRNTALQKFIEWMSQEQMQVRKTFAQMFAREHNEMEQVYQSIEYLEREFSEEMRQRLEKYGYLQAADEYQKLKFQSRQIHFMDDMARSIIRRMLASAVTENRQLQQAMRGEMASRRADEGTRYIEHTFGEALSEEFFEEFINQHTDIVYRQFGTQQFIQEHSEFYDILQDMRVLVDGLFGYTEQYLRRYAVTYGTVVDIEPGEQAKVQDFVVNGDVAKETAQFISVTPDKLYSEIESELVSYVSEHVTNVISSRYFRQMTDENRRVEEFQTERTESGVYRESVSDYENVVYETSRQMLETLLEKNEFFWTAALTKISAEEMFESILQLNGQVTEQRAEELWKENLILEYSQNVTSGWQGDYEYLESAVGEIISNVRNIILQENLNVTEQSQAAYVRQQIESLLVASKPVMEVISYLLRDEVWSEEFKNIRSHTFETLSKQIVQRHQSLLGNLYADVKQVVWDYAAVLLESNVIETASKEEFRKVLNETSNYHKTQMMAVRNYLSDMITDVTDVSAGLSKPLMERIVQELDQEIVAEAGRVWEDLESRLVVSERSADSYEYRDMAPEYREETLVGRFVYAVIEDQFSRVDEKTGERYVTEWVTEQLLKRSFRSYIQESMQLSRESRNEAVEDILTQLTTEQFLWQHQHAEENTYVELVGRIFEQYGESEAFEYIRNEINRLIESTDIAISESVLEEQMKTWLAQSGEFQKLYGFLEQYQHRNELPDKEGREDAEASAAREEQMTRLVEKISDRMFENVYRQMELERIFANVNEYLDKTFVYDARRMVREDWNVENMLLAMPESELLRQIQDYVWEELQTLTENLTYQEIVSSRKQEHADDQVVQVWDYADRITQRIMSEHSAMLKDFVREQYTSALIYQTLEQQIYQKDRLVEEIVNRIETNLSGQEQPPMERSQIVELANRYVEHIWKPELMEQMKALGKIFDEQTIRVPNQLTEMLEEYVQNEFTTDAAQLIYQNVINRNVEGNSFDFIRNVDAETYLHNIVRNVLDEHSERSSANTNFESRQNVSTLIQQAIDQQFRQRDRLVEEIVNRIEKSMSEQEQPLMEHRQIAEMADRYVEHIWKPEIMEQIKDQGMLFNEQTMSVSNQWTETFGEYVWNEFTADAAQMIYQNVISQNMVDHYMDVISNVDAKTYLENMLRNVINEQREHSHVSANIESRQNVNTLIQQAIDQQFRQRDRLVEEIVDRIEKNLSEQEQPQVEHRQIVELADRYVEHIWKPEIMEQIKDQGMLFNEQTMSVSNQWTETLEKYVRSEFTADAAQLIYQNVISQNRMDHYMDVISSVDAKTYLESMFRNVINEQSERSHVSTNIESRQNVSTLIQQAIDQQFRQRDRLVEEIVNRIEKNLSEQEQPQVEHRQIVELADRYVEHIWKPVNIEQTVHQELISEENTANIANQMTETAEDYFLNEFAPEAAQLIYQNVISQNAVENYTDFISGVNAENHIQRIVQDITHEYQERVEHITEQSLITQRQIREQAEHTESVIDRLSREFYMPSTFTELTRTHEKQQLYEREMTDRIVHRVLQTRAEEHDEVLHDEMVRSVIVRLVSGEVYSSIPYFQNSEGAVLEDREDGSPWYVDMQMIPSVVLSEEDTSMEPEGDTVIEHIESGFSSLELFRTYVQRASARTGRDINLVQVRNTLSHSQERADGFEYISLQYMEEYFDQTQDAGEVRFAVPVPAQDTQMPQQMEEKMNAIHSQIETLSQQVERIRSEQQSVNQSFVSKNEMELMRRNLVNNIEEDIFVAGKRHGVY